MPEVNEPDVSDRERAELLARRLRQLATAVERYSEAAGAHLGVNRSDLGALGLLSQATDDLTPGDLAQRLDLSPAAVTALLDRLEKVGHVRRRRHPHDGRKVAVAMTQTAAAAGQQAFGPLQHAVMDVLENLTTTQIDITNDVLGQVVAAIESVTDVTEDRTS